MVLVCPQCNARLQLDDAKAPTRPFSVRCPKCQASVNHSPVAVGETTAPSEEAPAANASDSPTRFEPPTAAPRYKPRAESNIAVTADEPIGDLASIAKLLAAALQQTPHPDGANQKRPKWDRRKALVCASPAYRETI